MLNTNLKSPGARLLEIDKATAFVPAHESFYGLSNDTQGTTFMDTVHALGGHGDDEARVLAYQSCAHGGRTLAQISKGTGGQTAYANTVLAARAFVRVAAAQGLGVVLRAVTLTHGEADAGVTSRAAYLALMRRLLDDNNADLRPITGQAEPIAMILDQLSASSAVPGPTEIALAQLDAVELFPDMFVSTPKYFFQGEYGMVSRRHLWPKGYALLGEYNGRVWHHLFQAQDGWKGLRPRELARAGKDIYVQFWVPRPPLVLDVSTLGPATHFGFAYREDAGAGTRAPAIEKVEIFDADILRIRLTGEPLGPDPRISYAYLGGEVTGGRSATWGNLRDSDDRQSRAIPGLPMPNWALAFEKDVPG